MSTLVTLFKSTETGAPTLSGTTGTLINVLSHCLIIGKVFSTANDSSFNDNTTEARLAGGTAFTLFPTPGTSDRTYIGHSVRFTQVIVDVQTASSGQTLVWEYWNGTAWSTLTVTDGTSGFTVDGTVTWTAPTNWATTAVNSSTLYWIRVRFTGSAPGTNPTINTISYLGWIEAFSGTNQRDYRQKNGNQFYFDVLDTGPGTGGAREARIIGYEAMTALGTGTGPFPTVGQGTFVVWRKSGTANGTARDWFVLADDRTLYFFSSTGDVSNYYSFAMFGDLYSIQSTADGHRTMIIGRNAEVAATTATGGDFGFVTAALGTTISGHFIASTYNDASAPGSGVSVAAGKHGDGAKSGAASTLVGAVPYYNNPDKALWASRIWIHQASSHLRGRMRGWWHHLHPLASFANMDTFTYSGKTFFVIKGSAANAASAPITGMYVIEISDTWETN